MLKIQEVFQIGLETVPGTPVAATLQVPLTGRGFSPKGMSGLGRIRADAHFPSLSDAVAVGRTKSGSAEIDLNKNIIRDIINLATKRTSGDLSTFTGIHQKGVAINRYSGCKVSELSLEFSQGGTPGDSAILKAASFSFECMKFEAGTGALASLTAPHANRFQIRHSSLSINSTAVTLPFSMRVGIRNNLKPGPVDASNLRAYLYAGDEELDIGFKSQFLTTALEALFAGQTEVPTNSIVFATGAATETVTASMGKLKLETFDDGDEDGVQAEEVKVLPYYGSAHQLTWAFGAGIPVSIIGL